MRPLRHPYTWGRDHPLVVDAFIAVCIAVVGIATELADMPETPAVYRDADAYSVALTLVATLPLTLRRRYPISVFLVALVATVLHGGQMYSGSGPWLAMMFGIYAVAAYGERRWALACLTAALVLSGWWILVAAPYELQVTEVVASVGTYVASWILGDRMRIRRAYVQAVEDRAAHLEREQSAEAERAVVEERSRIARELHDIVAHSMSVMVVQAGAARRTLERNPAGAAEAINQIEETGRGALAEMRRLVGVLRSHGDPEEESLGENRGPQPGIDQVPALINQCQEAGLDVTFRREGAERPLPSGIELVVYRVIQEALTNTMKHAGPAVRARVTLTYGKRVLTLLAVDDGRGAAALDRRSETPVRGRHGLSGMIERVSLYNGEMRWGPRRGGGFRVWVRLPLTRASGHDG